MAKKQVRKCYWCGKETTATLLCKSCRNPEKRKDKKSGSVLVIYNTI